VRADTRKSELIEARPPDIRKSASPRNRSDVRSLAATGINRPFAVRPWGPDPLMAPKADMRHCGSPHHAALGQGRGRLTLVATAE
jgi:hypothetical protein